MTFDLESSGRSPVMFVAWSFCCLILSLGAVVRGRVLSAVRTGPWQHEIVEGPHPEAVIAGNFTNTISQTGWAFLELRDLRTGNSVASDEEVAYLAGMIEANLTAPLILAQWKNVLSDLCSDAVYCDRLNKFLNDNNEFIMEQDKKDPYWYQITLFILQLAGLTEGYGQMDIEVLPDYALLYFQLHGDLDALESVLNSSSRSHVTGSGSCSALVKLLPGNSELLIGHDTWTAFHNMLRIFKLYDFKFKTSMDDPNVIPGHRLAFSSYPGRLYSGDDFYMSSSGLLTMETTNGNFNPALWQLVTPKSVLENTRVVVANRLASTGKEWCNVFGLHNSGTYNNQWMVVDYKLFEKGEADLSDGLLWVLEQLPGMLHAEDQTEMLRKQSYWPSYNIPFYSDIYQQSGFPNLAKQHGDWFTWSGSPRAKIFARNHTAITSIDSMIALMRYNNFQHDDLSRCNCTPPYSGENAISARCDLNPASGTYPFSALGHRAHGGIDSKVTSSVLFATLSCQASSGPTFDQQPVFQWSTSGFPRPLGHPDKWDFPPVLVQWKN